MKLKPECVVLSMVSSVFARDRSLKSCVVRINAERFSAGLAPVSTKASHWRPYERRTILGISPKKFFLKGSLFSELHQRKPPQRSSLLNLSFREDSSLRASSFDPGDDKTSK